MSERERSPLVSDLALAASLLGVQIAWAFYALPALVPYSLIAVASFIYLRHRAVPDLRSLAFVAVTSVAADMLGALVVLNAWTQAKVTYDFADAMQALGAAGIGFLVFEWTTSFAALRRWTDTNDWGVLAVAGLMILSTVATGIAIATRWPSPALRDRGVVTASDIEEAVASRLRDEGALVLEVSCPDAMNIGHGDRLRCDAHTSDGGQVTIQVTIFIEDERVRFFIEGSEQ